MDLLPGKGVTAIDVGCGFGGLTMALAEKTPEEMVLGIEIRPKVTEYVRLRIQAHRRRGLEKVESSEVPAELRMVPHLSSSHHNASVLKSNAMKYLPCLVSKGSLRQLFFCFADPQFKVTTHRRRIVNTDLLAEYAYALGVGGRLYFITDVPDLFNWMVAHTAAHPLFQRLSLEEESADPAVALMWTCTEESQKVAREGRTENVQSAVWVRLSDEAGFEKEKSLKTGGGGWWEDIPINYTYTPSMGALSKGGSRDWRAAISDGPESAAAKAAAAAEARKERRSRTVKLRAATASLQSSGGGGEGMTMVDTSSPPLTLPFGRTLSGVPSTQDGEVIPPGAFFAPSSSRNAQPIEMELRRILGKFLRPVRLLELACGSGQHAAHFVKSFPELLRCWQATDRESAGVDSSNAYRKTLREEHQTILRPAFTLDVMQLEKNGFISLKGGDEAPYDVVLAVNVLHISPLETTRALLEGASCALAPGGRLILYGPFKKDGQFTTPSNAEFDGQLKSLSPDFGLRDIQLDVSTPASSLGFSLEEICPMPANNFLLSFLLTKKDR